MKKIIFSYLLIFSFIGIYAQPGIIDTSFHSGTGFSTTITALAIQPDNKIIAGGLFTSYNGTEYKTLVRLNPNGTIDSSFYVGPTGFNSDIVAIHVYPEDTSVLVAGSFSHLNSQNLNTRIVKLKKDGSIDNTFNSSTNINSAVTAMAVDTSNGKIYIVGIFTSVAGVAHKHIARLMPDGTLDHTFTIGTGFTGSFAQSPPYAIKIQADGKILVGGDFMFYNDNLAPRFCRINTDGTLDNVFANNISGGGFNAKVLAIETMPDGKVIVGGSFTNVLAQNYNKIACLNANGSLNTSFTIGSGISGEVYTIKATPQNKILVGGSFNFYNSVSENSIIQLNENGTRDAHFITGTGLFTNNFSPKAYSFIIQPDSNIVVGGEFNKYNDTINNNIVRLIGKGVAQITAPELTTKSAALITNNSARLGGDIQNNGNSPIIEQGVCWSTSQNPNYHHNHASAALGNNDFTVFVYSLLDTTRYYVRAYAINGVDTAYGDQKSFITRSNENYTCGNVTFTYNGTSATYGTVKGKYGRCWMDRNLGANQIAESITDAQSYGGFYQWGRTTDGHQLPTSLTNSNLSPNTNPTHGDFITVQNAPFDWTSTPNNILWNGLNAANNPCPSGWRIPTSDEFLAEMTLWTEQNNIGAYESALRLPSGGVRGYLSGSRQNVGTWASYWTSEAFTSANANVKMLNAETSQAQIVNTYRAMGANVRCIKDYTVGIEESKVQNNTFSIYPNPANSNITINYTGDLSQKTNIAIYNYLGQEIMQSNLQSKTSTINVSDLTNGIYFVRVRTNKTQQVERLVIQK
jgi:uncharacterized delta-60 repeat protein/uncharacterized protein (TIGR02145 family)